MSGNGYVVVTGATGSIGRAICRRMVAAGRGVIVACRNEVRGMELVRELGGGVANVRCELLRLDDCASIFSFADRVSGLKIGTLINNAGVMNRDYALTECGWEQTLAVNYLGTVLLARLIAPAICDGGSMVFTTSVTRRLHSLADNMLHPNEADFSQLGTYGRSKLALTHYAMHLADEWRGRLRVNCADPGVVNTGMITMHRWFDPLANLFFRPLISSPERGAESALQAAASPYTGMVYHHSRYHPIKKELSCDEAHRRLIADTDELLDQVVRSRARR